MKVHFHGDSVFMVSTNKVLLVELLSRLNASSVQCSYFSQKIPMLLPFNLLEASVNALQSDKRNSSSLNRFMINRDLTVQMTLSAYY